MSTGPSRTRARRRRTEPMEAPEYAAMLRRMVRAYGRRVADADDVDLGEMGSVLATLEAAMQVAVDGQRARGASWSEIGRAFGISKQAAQQRFGHAAAAAVAV